MARSVAPKSRAKSKVRSVVRAERFEVVDAAGEVKAQLAARPDGQPGLAVLDPVGTARVLMGCRRTAPRPCPW